MSARIILSAAVTLGLFFAIAALGRVSTGNESPNGILRLAWRTAGEKVKICQELSEAEKAKIPVHMRRDAGCVPRIMPYRLIVELDGEQVIDRPIIPAGIHGDRPLYVQEDMALSPSQRLIEVRFGPDISLLAPAEKQHPEWAEAAARATQHRLEQTVTIAAGRVTFVGFGKDGLKVE